MRCVVEGNSLEEIIVNCDGFVAELNAYDTQVEDVEKAEEEVVLRTMEYETGSYFSISQQQFNKKYKKHRMNHKRVLEDSCTTTVIVMKFSLIGALVLGYFFIYYFMRRVNNNQFYNAGKLADINNRVEIESLNLLTLIKESIHSDMNSNTLSDIYTQIITGIEDFISLVTELGDVL
jgi:hypothetical protein